MYWRCAASSSWALFPPCRSRHLLLGQPQRDGAEALVRDLPQVVPHQAEIEVGLQPLLAGDAVEVVERRLERPLGGVEVLELELRVPAPPHRLDLVVGVQVLPLEDLGEGRRRGRPVPELGVAGADLELRVLGVRAVRRARSASLLEAGDGRLPVLGPLVGQARVVERGLGEAGVGELLEQLVVVARGVGRPLRRQRRPRPLEQLRDVVGLEVGPVRPLHRRDLDGVHLDLLHRPRPAAPR